MKNNLKKEPPRYKILEGSSKQRKGKTKILL